MRAKFGKCSSPVIHIGGTSGGFKVVANNNQTLQSNNDDFTPHANNNNSEARARPHHLLAFMIHEYIAGCFSVLKNKSSGCVKQRKKYIIGAENQAFML